MGTMTDPTACVFCDIIAGTGPATIVREWPDALAFVPLNPVVPDGGHILVVPRQHVEDAVENPAVTAATMARAAEFAAEHEASNIITSIGKAATQSVFHLHVHVIRRAPGDQLMVPWGTTGNPHDPHSCKRSTVAEEECERLRGVIADEYSRLSQEFDMRPDTCERCGGVPCSTCGECPLQGCWDCRCGQQDYENDAATSTR